MDNSMEVPQKTKTTIISVQSLSSVQLIVTLWMQHARPPCPSPTPEFTQTHVQWAGDAIQPSHPLSSPSPPALNLSQHQSLSSESILCIKWHKYWSFSLSISPPSEYSELISFRMDWLNRLVVRGTLKSLLQHHSSKASSLWRSAFFIVQLSHPYMTAGKTIALTRWTFVGKVMSLLFTILSRLVISFLPRSKHLLISQLQSPSTVILEPPKSKAYFYFIDYAKPFGCVDHNNLWKILKEVRKPGYLTCVLRNLYAGQEATVSSLEEKLWPT